MPLFKIIINVLSHYAIFLTLIYMKKKIFIGITFVIMLAIAIPVYLFTRNGKTQEVKRDYIVIRGIGTLWDHEIIINPKNYKKEKLTLEFAAYLLNFQTMQHYTNIYTKKGQKKILAKRGDMLKGDTTIQID